MMVTHFLQRYPGIRELTSAYEVLVKNLVVPKHLLPPKSGRWLLLAAAACHVI